MTSQAKGTTGRESTQLERICPFLMASDYTDLLAWTRRSTGEAGFLTTIQNMMEVARQRPYLDRGPWLAECLAFITTGRWHVETERAGKGGRVPCEDVLGVCISEVDLGRSSHWDAAGLVIGQLEKIGL